MDTAIQDLPKCRGCGLVLMDEAVEVLDNFWHPLCLKCQTCGLEMLGKDMYFHEMLPYCLPHYQLLTAKLCSTCQKPITDKIVAFNGASYHPTCVPCFGCGVITSASGGTFVRANLPCCKSCATLPLTSLPPEVRGSHLALRRLGMRLLEPLDASGLSLDPSLAW